MQIVLYRTTKRDNSTATPDSAPALFSNRITKDVRLKETIDELKCGGSFMHSRDLEQKISGATRRKKGEQK